MTSLLLSAVLLAAAIAVSPLSQTIRIGGIEFFGYAGVDLGGSGADFQLATRYGKRGKHFLHYMAAIFNYPSYLHQSRPEHTSPRCVISRGCRLRHGGSIDLNSRP